MRSSICVSRIWVLVAQAIYFVFLLAWTKQVVHNQGEVFAQFTSQSTFTVLNCFNHAITFDDLVPDHEGYFSLDVLIGSSHILQQDFEAPLKGKNKARITNFILASQDRQLLSLELPENYVGE